MIMTDESFKTWYEENQEGIQEDFFKFLSFPSISTDPQYKPAILETAKWLKDYLQEIGLEAEIWETSSYPVVFGSYLKAGKDRPTVLLYHHYDVQPVDPLELWDSEPFKPTVRNNKVYARGAVDNKGQCFYSITALKAFLSLADKANLNIKVFIEGEEESGGSGTFEAIRMKKEALRADHLLIVDLGIPAPDVPGMELGTRGIVALHAEFSNSSVDLHSGAHGGIALNPNRAMVKVLSELWDGEGKVAVPGFYDDVVSLSKDELSHLDMDFDRERYKKDFGVNAFAPEKGYSLTESNWIRPTLEINGISGGYTGMGFKTVIPSKAIAKISCRLVLDQDPNKVVASIESFLRSRLPNGIQLRIEKYQGVKAFRTPHNAKIVKICAEAFEEVFGKKCLFQMTGGSIPIIPDLKEASGADVALIGVGLGTDDIHAPNEHFGLDRFEKGYLVISKILTKLANI